MGWTAVLIGLYVGLGMGLVLIGGAAAWIIDTLTGQGWATRLVVHSGIRASSLILVITPVTVGLLVLLAVRRRLPAREYFALKRLRADEVLVSTVLLVALLAAGDLMLRLLGNPILSDFDRSLLAPSAALVLVIPAVCVAAPVLEELWWRGFVYKGIAASRVGTVAAVLITATLWALLHAHLSWLRVGGVFCLGLYFGAVRWKTGSTTLTILLHAATNLLVLVEALTVQMLAL